MNWLEILGSLGSGVSQGIPQGMQEAAQYQQSQGASALGDALAGVQSSSGQPTGVFSGLTSAINNMMGGQSPQIQIPQAPQAQFQQAPAIPSSMISQAAPQPVSIPAMSPASPMTAQAAPSAIGPQAAPQTTLSQTPQGGQGQPFSPVGTYHPPIPPQQGQQAPQGQQAQGFMTLNDLVDGLKKARPGIRGQQMTEALKAGMPLLNEEGRRQAQELGMMARLSSAETRVEQMKQQAYEFGQKMDFWKDKLDWLKTKFEEEEKQKKEHEKGVAGRARARVSSKENEDRMKSEMTALAKEYSVITKELKDKKLPPDQEAQALAEVNKKYNENRAEIMKRYQTAPQAEPAAQGSGQPSGVGGDESPDIIHDPKTGKMYKYKGSGDRSDINSYEPTL